MREAWDRTEFERKKENKKREKSGINKYNLGLSALPHNTFEEQYQELCKKLFQEIEEKKEHY
jgi:DnaJ family protein C protein 8